MKAKTTKAALFAAITGLVFAAFVAEHGLSLLIEHGGERILFDTGAGAALRPNAAKLGIDLDGVTRIVLSHSHNDHTGGLGVLAPKCPIYVGDGFDVPVVWGAAGSILILSKVK